MALSNLFFTRTSLGKGAFDVPLNWCDSMFLWLKDTNFKKNYKRYSKIIEE